MTQYIASPLPIKQSGAGKLSMSYILALTTVCPNALVQCGVLRPRNIYGDSRLGGSLCLMYHMEEHTVLSVSYPSILPLRWPNR